PQPVARPQVIGQSRLGAAGFRGEAVFPAHPRRQAHQDRFAASARLQPEQRAAVVYQVELDVASAPVQLELALAFAMRHAAATFDDRQVGIEETIADRAQVGEVALEVRVQVVEEQAADAAGLVAMLDEEIFVAPALVRGVARLPTEWVAQRARAAMPVQYVLVERIERRQVEAATEPPRHGFAIAPGLEVADVGVRGRHVGIAWM